MTFTFGTGLAAMFRLGSSQQQVNQQVAVTGGAAATQTQDQLVKDKHRAQSLRLVGNKVGERRVLDKAGVTKVCAAKKR